MNIFKSKIWRIGERVFMIISVIVIATVIVRAVDNKVDDGYEGEISDAKCPADMSYVPTTGGYFCIDKYEASPGEECPYENPGAQAQSLTNIDSEGCEPASVVGAMPWSNISQNQAAIACAKAGKRLPTNKEWLQAALGTPDRGDSWGVDDCQVSKNWSVQPGLAGTGKKCVSAAGVYDMIGNVWEWVDGSTFDGTFNDKSLPGSGYVLAVDSDAIPSETGTDQGDNNYYEDYFWLKTSGTRGMARGGYWDNESDAGQYSVYAVSPPSYTGKGVGFRCAR